MVNVLTQREKEIIQKRINQSSLTQNESNILSRYVRPKLRRMCDIHPAELLQKIEYNQKTRVIEDKIRKIILNNVKGVDSIIVCGSAIQTNYREYNDIDVIIAMRKLIKSKKEERKIVEKIEEAGIIEGLKLDVQIYAKKLILSQYSSNPSLIYQLKDSRVIYGKLRIPERVDLSGLDLKMKLDWSEGLSLDSDSEEIYYAIRNAILVLLLMNKIVDNYILRKNLTDILGVDLVFKLRKNLASKLEKKLALSYLELMTLYLEEELRKSKWEKIEIEMY
jgi:predicted nucleotidyltransferase